MATEAPGLIQNVMTKVFGKPTPAPAPIAQTPAPSPAPAPEPAPAPPAAPLDKYTKLWETRAVDPNAPKPKVSFLDNVNADNVSKAAKAVPFANVATPEQLAIIEKGGKDGVATMLQVMESMSQEAYGKGALATTALMKEALKEERQKWDQEFSGRVRSSQISGSASVKNPILSNPALAPITNLLEQQFAKQFPAESPDNIAAMVADYWNSVRETLVPVDPNAKPTPKSGENIDWDQFAQS